MKVTLTTDDGVFKDEIYIPEDCPFQEKWIVIWTRIYNTRGVYEDKDEYDVVLADFKNGLISSRRDVIRRNMVSESNNAS